MPITIYQPAIVDWQERLVREGSRAIETVDASRFVNPSPKKEQDTTVLAEDRASAVSEAQLASENPQETLGEVSEALELHETQPQKEVSQKPVLSDLSLLAQELTSETDELTRAIETINEKLCALHLELEVWCQGSNREYGFAHVDDQWQLANRQGQRS